MELTKDEKKFIANILSQINVSPANPNAVQLIQTIQEILKKIEVKEGE